MDALRAAPLAGAVAAGLVALLVAAPLALGSEVAALYASGVVSPLLTGFFAAVAVVVFAAGHQRRSPPDLVAGAGLVVGLVVVLTAAGWAGTASLAVVSDASTSQLLNVHRWALVVVALGIPAAAGWYTRALEIF